jgi:CheY-like chemotaxis protein
VLIVDDEAEFRAALGDRLRREGFDALEAANGLEALAQITRVRPGTIVLDLTMPRLGGIEALKWIRALDSTIRVIIVTGTDDTELHRQALSLGAVAVFMKPLRGADLVAALATAPPPAAPPPPAASVSAPPTSKILVVDGEPEVRATLEELLKGQGYETRSAGDGPSGVRAMLDWWPDVVLLDIGMPDLWGISTVPVIAALAPSTKVILVTRTTGEEISRQALAHGAFDYVTTPVDFTRLAQAIEAALAMKRMESGG